MKFPVLIIICLLVLCPGLLPAEESFGGIGIDGVMLPDHTIIVRQIVAGGPAHLAGIMVGDIITHIDGKTTAGMDFNTIVQKKLRGRAGSKITLLLRRKKDDKIYSVRLTRQQLLKKDDKRGTR